MSAHAEPAIVARVAGFDAVREAGQLRTKIGLAGQYAAGNENLTGRENLTMVGRPYGMSRRSASRRSDELLERFDLVDAARHNLDKISLSWMFPQNPGFFR